MASGPGNSKLDRLPALHVRKHGATERCNGVPRQRTPLRRLRHKALRFTSNDRVSQTFDLAFDLSAHDMFVAWQNGACVCCPTQKQLIKPGAFVNDARLTVWFSVPSTAVFMRRLGGLKPGMYPQLRLSLFCGEALPAEIIRQWRLAAPNS